MSHDSSDNHVSQVPLQNVEILEMETSRNESPQKNVESSTNSQTVPAVR